MKAGAACGRNVQASSAKAWTGFPIGSRGSPDEVEHDSNGERATKCSRGSHRSKSTVIFCVRTVMPLRERLTRKKVTGLFGGVMWKERFGGKSVPTAVGLIAFAAIEIVAIESVRLIYFNDTQKAG